MTDLLLIILILGIILGFGPVFGAIGMIILWGLAIFVGIPLLFYTISRATQVKAPLNEVAAEYERQERAERALHRAKRNRQAKQGIYWSVFWLFFIAMAVLILSSLTSSF